MITISDALFSLRPKAEWSIDNDDLATLVWHTPDVEPLTQAEVDAEVARLKQAAVNEAAEKAVARAVLLERLGLTDDEFEVLVGGIA